MLTTTTNQRTTLFLKLAECALAALAIVNTLAIVLELVPEKYFKNLSDAFWNWFLVGEVILGVVVGMGYSIYWHQKEKKATINSGKIHAILRGIIRYWLVSELCTYGFAKILGTQFHTPDYGLDMVLSDVSGFRLTWYYYGYSYTLAVILACFQIGGACLLLFRRTTLLGAFILLPVMVNILLINIFFSIANGAFLNSVYFTLALIFLILIEWKKVQQFFFSSTDNLPPIKLGIFKNILRVATVAAAFWLIYSYIKKDDFDKKLKGTWHVDTLIKNGDTLPKNAWQTDTTAWTKIYFDGVYGCAFCPNPYKYIPKQSMRGSYTYDTTAHTLVASFEDDKKHADTLKATISQLTTKSMVIKGILAKDTIVLNLSRVERKKR